MNHRLPDLAEQYASALREYLDGAGEASLQRAYEFGRQAVECGLGLLEIDSLYQEAQAAVLQCARTPEESLRLMEMAADFRAEILAPFEMAQLSFREANDRLRQLNRMLESEIVERQRAENALRKAQDELELRVQERTSELAKANIALQAEITKHRRTEAALKESEERFRQTTALTGEWIWEQDADGRYIYSSSAVKSILGFEPEEVTGKYYYEFFVPEVRAQIESIAHKQIEKKEPFFRIVNRYWHKDGYEVFTESSGLPLLDNKGILLKWRGIDHDITERKCFVDALRLRDHAIEASSVGIIITDACQPGNPISYSNPAFAQMTGYSQEELLGSNPRILQGPETDPEAIEAIRKALSEARSCLITLKNYRKDGTTFWNELFISPVRDEEGRVTHYIGTQTDVTELRRAEEERHELEIAKQIQLSLLPRAPLQIDSAFIAGYCLPATHVGGDYFDYFSEQNTVDIVIADVSGHSVGAALVMAETRSTLKAEAHRKRKAEPRGTGDILNALNVLLYEDLNRADLFITMFYMRYNTETKRLNYANAGHNCPLLLVHGASTCRELDAEGLILGINKEVEFEEKSASLQKGDIVLLYTDGIIEAQNQEDEFFGRSRLNDLLVAHRQCAPQKVISEIIHELQSFSQSSSFSDDISMVVLKVI
ncbi:MAG: SpoIIE family protein phosphatase [Pseudomonadota bacterium]